MPIHAIYGEKHAAHVYKVSGGFVIEGFKYTTPKDIEYGRWCQSEGAAVSVAKAYAGDGPAGVDHHTRVRLLRDAVKAADGANVFVAGGQHLLTLRRLLDHVTKDGTE